MNVLSLFDGISCGQLALNKAGIPYDKYYASEIDENAIKVAMDNYPDTIQLGDVTKIDIKKLPKIDLLIGGSPCQGFSISGKRLGIEDERSKLFYNYADIYKTIKPKYFLLENVVMTEPNKQVITNELECHGPLKINSRIITAQNRDRLYWTNIQHTRIKPKKVLIQDIIDPSESDKYIYIPDEKTRPRIYRESYVKYKKGGQFERAFYPHSKHACTTTMWNALKIIQKDKRIRFTTRKEVERLQTVPDNYTKIIKKDAIAIGLLGNGWTVDIIAHIFEGLRKTPIKNPPFIF